MTGGLIRMIFVTGPIAGVIALELFLVYVGLIQPQN